MVSNGNLVELDKEVFVLVTGANSGLGLSICCRLIDEFLSSRPDPYRLTIIFTTRSARKGSETFSRLKQHLNAAAHRQARGVERVTFVSETVDLVDLVSVRALSLRLVKKLPKLDAIVLNAGLGGWTGIDWPRAVWGTLTDLIQEVTWPSFKVSPIGVVTGKQTHLAKEPRLGMVFSANVFGHYMLAHGVVPLLQLSGQPNGPGRIIWVSSLEAALKYFDPEDIQGLRSGIAYESSKTLTDILALTANLPSTAPWVNSFLCTSNFSSSSVISTMEEQVEENSLGRNPTKPNIYLTHPGVCGTSILPLSLPLFYCMIFSCWLARMLGSPWHVLSSYLGACAPVWLTLSHQRIIDNAETPYVQHEGRSAKWGSSCCRLGRARPASTEVDGWGYGGVVGRPVMEEDRIRRRKRGMVDLTAEKKEQFEELGIRCWREMEELRKAWDSILDEAEAI